MGKTRNICSFLTTLSVIATFSILPSDGITVCPWCDNSMQPILLDCMYTGMISDPALMMIPLPDIEDFKRNVASYSIARNYMLHDDKKVTVDNEFCREIANMIKKNNLQNNHAIVNVMAELAGNCYSSVTELDRNAITQDVKALVQDVLKKNTNSNPPPNISSPSQDSKSIDSDSSGKKDQTPVSSSSKAPQKKTAGNEQSDDEELACYEKFKIAVYDALLNDDRFRTCFGKLPISDTKPEVLKIMKHAFKEYGIQHHYTEFSTLWRFDSKALNKESSVEDWAEVISNNLQIIFSRNNLLKGDCEEAGKKMAGYILGTFPGEPAVSSTENKNQNDGNSETSTEPNTSDQKANQTYPATSTAAENNLNPDKSSDSGNLSEMMLSKIETKENLKKLH